jgi:hypothetical protein
MGWMAPLRHRRAKLVFWRITRNREPSMSEITTIGLDLGKHVFQVHGIDAAGRTVLRKRLRRGQVLAFFRRIPPCLVGLEVCATAHYWARLRSSRSRRRLPRWRSSCWSGTRRTRSVSGWPAFRALDRSSLLPLPRRLRTRVCSARAASSRPGWAWCRGRIQPAGNPGSAASPSAAIVICAGCSSMGQAPICCDRRRPTPIRG